MHFLGVEISFATAWGRLIENEGFAHALEQTEKVIRVDAEAGLLTPPVPQQIFRFLTVPEVKVVMVGQDPYFNRGEATGFAFEVGGITRWQDLLIMPRNAVPSLKRILRKLHMEYTGASRPEPLAKVAAEADSGVFPILPPHKLFDYWARSGVLLLNRSLTTRLGVPFAHEAAWTVPGQLIASYVAATWSDALWFLWGTEAEDLGTNVPEANKVIASHPNPRCIGYANPKHFINSDCFSRSWEDIDWLGQRL